MIVSALRRGSSARTSESSDARDAPLGERYRLNVEVPSESASAMSEASASGEGPPLSVGKTLSPTVKSESGRSCKRSPMLYPALHRMEDKGWIDAEWGTSENNRRAKFYSLTGRGRKQLQSESASWLRFSEAVGKVLRANRQPA